MRKIIAVVVILSLLSVPALGYNKEDGKPTPRTSWAETKQKILATRDDPMYKDAFVIGVVGVGYIYVKLIKGPKYYRVNIGKVAAAKKK